METLRLGSDIAADSLRLQRTVSFDPDTYQFKKQYVLSYGTEGDVVLFDDHPGILGMTYVLDDGTSLTHRQVLEQSNLPFEWTGTAAAETVTGTDLGDALFGQGGGDTVHGGGGNDMIQGAGNIGEYLKSDLTNGAFSNGLLAGAYRKGNGEVVIACKGTDFLLTAANETMWKVAA